MNKIIMKLLTIFIIFATNFMANSQENLYFVGATPFLYHVAPPEDKPVIYNYNNDRQAIDTFQVLSSRDSCNLLFLNVYHEYNTLVMYEEGFRSDNENYLSMVDLQTPKEVKTRRIDFGKRSTRQANLIVEPDGRYYYCIHIGGVGYYGYNKELKQFKVKPRVLNESYIKGDHENGIYSVDHLTLNVKNNTYYIRTRTYDKDIDIPYSFKPPDSLFKDWDIYRYYNAVAVNNHEAVAIVNNNSIPDSTKLGTIGYQIKCKKSNEWYFKKFKGGLTAFRGYGPWLAGEVEDYGKGTYYLEHGEPIRFNFNRKTPGREFREPYFSSDKEMAKRGGESTSFDARNNRNNDYFPGILLLYNVQTRNYIEWKTTEQGKRQGDSEILLVQDGTVYYRINDKIYKAPIINGKKLGESELLIQDERVPDIPWAFITEE